MVSVLSRCKGIGEPTLSHKPLHFRSSFGRRTPRSMRRALDGMTDPQVANWQYLGPTFKSENNSDSREAQGMTTDGTKWYLCSNGSKRIIVFDDDWNRLVTVSPTSTIWDAWRNDPTRGTADDWGPGEDNPHLGAPCIHENILYIPIQAPRGVWRLNLTTAAQSWLHPSELPDGDLFPWVAIHPVTGLLYTSNYHTPGCPACVRPERPEHTAVREGAQYSAREDEHLPRLRAGRRVHRLRAHHPRPPRLQRHLLLLIAQRPLLRRSTNRD